MSLFGTVRDRWLGRGTASIALPPMDGALRPNDRLDASASVLTLPAPDDLALTSRGLVVSSGGALLCLDRPEAAPLAQFDADITALAGLPDGGAAVGLADGRIRFVGGQHDGLTLAATPDIGCITAIAPTRDGALLVANGSESNGPANWARDLMERNASGSVWRIDPAGAGRQRLAGALAYPCGLLEETASVVVSESWRNALVRIQPGGKVASQPVLDGLPAYPGRMARSPNGVLWLTFFAPRSQLVEFVLTEDRYRRRMLAEIDPEFWVAPCLRSGQRTQEPVQQGGVRQLGVLKPWSPSRSYGLVVRLDAAYRPTASFHSRANGHRHGVTACLPHQGHIYVCAKGDGMVVTLPEAEVPA